MSFSLTGTVLGSPVSLILQPLPVAEGECIVTTTIGGVSMTAKGFHMAYTLPDDHQIAVQVAYVDAHGHPAQIDGPVVWSSSDATILSVTADTTVSTQATIAPVGALGQAQAVATADADLGTGVRSLITTFDVTVVAGAAVAGTITPVGDPTPVAA